jgi:large subunit ribosomal protein L3
MPKAHVPRRGSMGVWPRKRAKRHFASVNAWADSKDAKLLGFAGYKVGMTHITVTDNQPNSTTKGREIIMPVTIIECPPLKTASIVLYKKDAYGLKQVNSIMASKLDKELGKKIILPKKEIKIDEFNIFTFILIIYIISV